MTVGLFINSNGPTNADYAFHEFSSLRLATEHEIASLDCWGETFVLLDSFRLASQQSWDCSQSVHCAVFWQYNIKIMKNRYIETIHAGHAGDYEPMKLIFSEVLDNSLQQTVQNGNNE